MGGSISSVALMELVIPIMLLLIILLIVYHYQWGFIFLMMLDQGFPSLGNKPFYFYFFGYW